MRMGAGEKRLHWLVVTRACVALFVLLACFLPGCIPEEDGVLELSVSNVKVPNIPNTQKVQVTATGNWFAYTESTWVTFINNKGSGDGEIFVRVEANPSAGERAASIGVKSDDYPGVRVLVITQPKGAPSLTVSRSEIAFPAPSATTDTVKIISTLSWKISLDQPWLKIDVGSGTGTTVLTVKADPLSGLTRRTGNITVQSKDGLFKRTIKVTQNPKVMVVAGGTGQGLELKNLSMPAAVCVDGQNIFVADQFNNRIVRWSNGSNIGVVVAGGQGIGSNLDQLANPTSISIGTDGAVYVADYANNRIVRWAAESTTGEIVAGGNGVGIGLNQVVAPTGLFVNQSGEIFIAESALKRVTKWTPSSSVGEVIAWENSVANPTAVYVDVDQNVYVASEANDHVTKWKPDGTHAIVAGGNGRGSDLNQLNAPSGLFVDAGGNLYISDKGNNRIVKWLPESEEGILVAGGNGAGAALDQLNAPAGIWVNGNGDIFVADQRNHRIVKWLKQ